MDQRQTWNCTGDGGGAGVEDGHVRPPEECRGGAPSPGSPPMALSRGSHRHQHQHEEDGEEGTPGREGARKRERSYHPPAAGGDGGWADHQREGGRSKVQKLHKNHCDVHHHRHHRSRNGCDIEISTTTTATTTISGRIDTRSAIADHRQASSDGGDVDSGKRMAVVVSSWERLPEQILCLIWSFHSQVEVIRTMFFVCKRWYRIARRSDILWRTLDFTSPTMALSSSASPSWGNSSSSISTADSTATGIGSMEAVISFLQSLVRDPLHMDPAPPTQQLHDGCVHFGSPTTTTTTTTTAMKAIKTPCSSSGIGNNTAVPTNGMPTTTSVTTTTAQNIVAPLDLSHFTSMEDMEKETENDDSDDDDNTIARARLLQAQAQIRFQECEQTHENSHGNNHHHNHHHSLMPKSPTRIQRIHFPKNCSNMVAENFMRLGQLYSWFEEIVIPPMMNQGPTAAQPTQESSQSLDDECLQLLAKFPLLTKLKMTYQDGITDQGIDAFSRNTKRLSEISMDCCPNLTSASFHHLFQNCSSVTSLSMLNHGNCIVEHKDIQLLTASAAVSRLKELRINVGKSVEHESFRSLVTSCGSLRTLYLRGCQNMTGKSLQMICSELYHLEHITVACGNGVRLIAPNIQSFTLKTFQIIHCDGFVEPSFTCPQLQSIIVDHCGTVQGIHFSGYHVVTEMRFRSCSLSEIDCKSVFHAQLPQLRELEFFECTLLGEGCENAIIQSSTLEKMIMLKCETINSLTLRCPKLSTVSIDMCPEIKSLHFDCPALEQAQLFVLPQIQQPKLRTLSILSKKLRTMNLQRTVLLENLDIICPQLDSLNMSGCRNLKGFSRIECPKLNKLAIGSSMFDFSTRAIPLMKQCSTVTMLSITHSSRLTDHTLQTICSHLQRLQALVISNCNAIRNPKLCAPLLKGIQLMECSSLESFQIESSLLSKFFLRGCPRVTDTALSTGLESCVQVKFIEVFGCDGLIDPVISGTGVTDVHFNKCPQLRYPTLSCPSLKKVLFLSCEQLTGMSLTHNSPNLAEACFTDCPRLNDAFIHRLQQYFPNVQALVFSGCHGLQRPKFFGFNGLKMLRFVQCDRLISPILMEKSCDTIKVLSFSRCLSLSFDGHASSVWPFIHADLVEFNNCDGLRELIFDVPVQSLIINHCKSLCRVAVFNEHVNKVTFTHCPSIITLNVIDCIRMSDIVAQNCREFAQIDFHTIGGTQWHRNSIANVEFTDCPKISDACIQSLLNKSPHLRTLSLTACGLSRAVIRHAEMETLTLRNGSSLAHVDIDCALLRHLTIAECPKLQFHQDGSVISRTTLTSLEHFEMFNATVLDDFMHQIMTELSRKNSQLERVNFVNCGRVNFTTNQRKMQ